ncbi:hypothetical protein NDI76_03885 [Halogeometricum sp. S1BR25-6]|uniref:DUF8059 domain-containing protein n=2 Tax=Halogeometricum TaxID=60846 RepID=A0ABU2GAM4_9EURY|nr:hypothetical protein [Halogeometricum sp. S1BR25-6]MDS0297872.1 hypothetical protein [Halogeometricum sp. S1BR25-6]
MSRILKTSGFLGLTVMMGVGLYMAVQLETGGGGAWLVPGHAHMGVLSILAVVMGSQVDALNVAGRVRRATTGLYLVGQWMLPLAVWGVSATGIAAIGMSTLLWGLCLVASMLLMAHQAWTVDRRERTGPGTATAAAD